VIKTENNIFKMLYIIAIFMIVDGHIGSYDYLNLNNLLRYQNYHIALFMFTSGYFLNLSRSYQEFFSRKISRLIIPLYLWNLFYGIVCFCLNNYGNFSIGGELNFYNLLIAPITDGHQYIYNMASWFLVPLFFVQTVGFLILKPLADKKSVCPQWSYLIFFIISLICGILALHFGPENNGERNLTLTILRTFYFLPSFAFGILYHHALEKYDTLNTPLYLCILLTIIALICYRYPGYNHVPSWLDSVNAPALAIYILSFLAILFWLRVAKVLSPFIKQSTSLKYISNHTFDIMMHHFVGLMLIKAMLSGLPDFNHTAYKTNIWYNYFLGSEELSAWGYIVITIVIALLTGFTSRLIGAKIKNIISNKMLLTGRNKK